jgi:hypothetical protein
MEVNAELIEKYRHFNVDNLEWWDSTYECFRNDMQEVGIEVERMFFSGFWNQGDGACFEGRVDDIKLFLDRNFAPSDYPLIRKLVAAGGHVYVECGHTGYYYHENSTAFSIGADSFATCLETPTETHEQVINALDFALSTEMMRFEEDAIEIFRNFMRKLYRELEQEYDYLTSDEAVKESIIANDLTEPTEGE